jgi:drug/metabolite transporter (DMT)-like permease
LETAARPPAWKILLAFAIIYFVWGSTYLAIRVGVHEVPPFLLAAIRFLVSGIVLYGWMRLKGTPSPSGRQWTAATLLVLLCYKKGVPQKGQPESCRSRTRAMV